MPATASTAGRGCEQGIGKPEPLRDNLSACWSRRIDDSHRLVWGVEGQA